MKKMILGVLLSVIGLIIFSTIFLAVFLVQHTIYWYEKIVNYGLGLLFWFSIILMLAGIVICVAETFKKE